jgi:hypothetical protein
MKKLFLFLLFMPLAVQLFGQKQGIEGEVFWLGGNQMPGPGTKASPRQGVVREVYIYNATNLKDAKQQGVFFSDVRTALVAKVMSAADGSFKVKLPYGKYSVFVKEEQGLFANLYDGSGCINCISVRPRKYSWVTVLIDYEAAY